MSHREPDDVDNPLWTLQDFARAQGPRSLPEHVLLAFPHTVARIEQEGDNFSIVTILSAQGWGAKKLDLAA